MSNSRQEIGGCSRAGSAESRGNIALGLTTRRLRPCRGRDRDECDRRRTQAYIVIVAT